MKKIKSIVLFLVVAALLSLVLLSFTGCGKAKEEVTVDTKQGETETKESSEPVDVKYVREDCDKEYEGALKVIDEVIASAKKNSEDMSNYAMENVDNQGKVSLTFYFYNNDSIKHGYYDINNDGKYELIVTSNIDGVDKIVEIYYINKNGEATLMVDPVYGLGDKSDLEIYSNGTIKVITEYEDESVGHVRKLSYDIIKSERATAFNPGLSYYVVGDKVYDNGRYTNLALYDSEEKIDEYYINEGATKVSLDEMDIQ